MSTAITSTKIAGPHCIGPNFKVAIYKIANPDSWTAAGVALDLSADFDYVTSYTFGCSGAVTDHGYAFNLIGTYTTGLGYAASGLSVVAHWSAATATNLDDVNDTTDLSAVNDIYLIVLGN
jgi:hypothetical protein